MISSSHLVSGRSQIHCRTVSHRSLSRGFSGNPRFPAQLCSGKTTTLSTDLCSLGFSIRSDPGHPATVTSGGLRNAISRCMSENISDNFEPGDFQNQEVDRRGNLMDILSKANSILPYVTIATTVLALVYPPSFTWFTTRYYAPALGFLMFAVGVNSNERDFIESFKRPSVILAGYIGQFVLKPLLGFLIGTMAVQVFGLPTAAGVGIMLTSCVSGAQLSNYATFLTDPSMAPLSIVMTSLSTATAVFVTPALSLLLIGKRLPVDVKGMINNILQIVVTPIAAGMLLNRLFPKISNAIRPFLPPLSVIVTSLSVGAPLAINIGAVMSPFGLAVLLLVVAFHLSAFASAYMTSGLIFRNIPDAKPIQRTLSYETGMQSSLLALTLANRFFEDPIVGVPPAISVVVMSLLGFLFVMIWTKDKQKTPQLSS